jgi:Dyp-type peroxidase family
VDSGAAEIRVDQADLQGNVLCGYGNEFRHGHYAFVQFADGVAARRLLEELAPRLTNAVPWDGQQVDLTLNVALTFDGLAAVGVPGRALETFPDDFREGMEGRATLLGDTGENEPSRWDRGLRAGDVHLMIAAFARDARLLSEHRRRVDALLATGGLTLAHEVGTELLPHPGENHFAREHFGFADGLAQPSIAGERVGPYKKPGKGVPEPEGGWRDVAPGEFVLGYTDEDGVTPKAPAEPFHRNASFVVVRKLEQDVAGLTQYLREAAGGDPKREELLAAKIVGRWRDGTPLVSSPDAPDERFAPGGELADAMNQFRYGDDPDGIRCPLGAHIRRANPRDAFGADDRRTRRHRIIRRGMPYGRPPADPGVADGMRRGLLFVCYQASIERQFETIQRSWLNDGDALGLGDEKDFLLSGDEPGGTMTIQGSPPRFLPRASAFVALKGGGYLFAPSISAVRALGRGELSSY